MADVRGPHGSPHAMQGARGTRSRTQRVTAEVGVAGGAGRPHGGGDFAKAFPASELSLVTTGKIPSIANAPTVRTPYRLSLQKKRLKPGIYGDPEQKTRTDRGLEATQPEGLGRNRKVLQEMPRPIHCHSSHLTLTPHCPAP